MTNPLPHLYVCSEFVTHISNRQPNKMKSKPKFCQVQKLKFLVLTDLLFLTLQGTLLAIYQPIRLVGEHQPDILCLEQSAKFYLESFAKKSGYQNQLIFGSNGYTTLAILSKELPLKLVLEAKSKGESIRSGEKNIFKCVRPTPRIVFLVNKNHKNVILDSAQPPQNSSSLYF